MGPAGGRQLSRGVLALAVLLALGMVGASSVRDEAGPETPAATLDPIAVAPEPSPSEAPPGPVMGLDFIHAVVTGYSSTPDQTDETPWLTAWSTQTRPGVIALSRDLLRTFTDGAPFDFGDRILVAGVGVFLVEDTMADRWTNRADIWFPTRFQAQQWGRRETLLARVQEEARVDVVAEDQLAAILDEPQP